MEQPNTPAEAVDQLVKLYDRAVDALVGAIRRYAQQGTLSMM